MIDDRATVLATMYQDDDPVQPSPAHPNTQGRTHRIRVGAIDYEVPSIAYLNYLEQLIERQTQTLTRQQQLIDRLVGMMARSRNTHQAQGRITDDLRRELDKKLSVREFA